jgi:hypothetical protein
LTDDCIVAVVSDLHPGSTTGLAPFYFEHEGGQHKANAGQRWLWRNWKDFWERMGRLSDDTGLPLLVISNGDAADGPHHGTTELITHNEGDLLRLAVTVWEPALAVADRMIVIRGTPAHTGDNAWKEERLADDLTIVERQSEQTASFWHWYGEAGGVFFDVQHHPEAGGRRPWTIGNGPNAVSSMLLEEYARTNDRVPDVGLRSHVHVFQTSSAGRKPFVIFTPSWQLGTSYVKGPVASNKINSVGGIYFICRDGTYSWDHILYHPRRERARRIEWTS